ncbi:hypothetical protein QE368_001711 [Asaia bogorensis NBRC 16594]|nr:hypothetical protein [Asaia bogorensis NBRC 16594]
MTPVAHLWAYTSVSPQDALPRETGVGTRAQATLQNYT